MPRILTKGFRSDIKDDHFDWNKEEDLKSYNIAFYDLSDLVPCQNEFLRPWFDEEDAAHFPSRSDVTQILGGNNDLIIRLPEKKEMGGLSRLSSYQSGNLRQANMGST
jgi:hypothetical protein